MEALTSTLNWNLEVLVLVEGGKLENPEENPWSKVRTNNKLNPHETTSMGIEPGSKVGGECLSTSKSVLPVMFPSITV